MFEWEVYINFGPYKGLGSMWAANKAEALKYVKNISRERNHYG